MISSELIENNHKKDTAIIDLVDFSGNKRSIDFDLGANTIRWSDTGQMVDISSTGYSYQNKSLEPWEHHKQANINPSSPGKKRGPFKLVKIQLGLKCNFSCSYCAQSPEPEATFFKDIKILSTNDVKEKEIDKSPKINDVEDFLSNIHSWAKPEDEVFFELWGGEPFVYWTVFKPLAEGLLSRYPKCHISTTTNGALINEEILDWVISNDRVNIAISHDGDSRHRDYDVLENSYVKRLFRALLHTSRPLKFNCVLTSGNLSVLEIRDFIASKLKVPPRDIYLSTEGLATPVGLTTVIPEIHEFSNLFKELISGQSAFVFNNEFSDFMSLIAQKKPSFCIEQKCGLDRPDAVVVNLRTQEVVTCQNTLPIGKHKLGHINDLANVKLNTVHHWRSRPSCAKCPVLAFCKGSCLYLEDDVFQRACVSSYRYRLPFLCAVIYFITGMIPVRMVSPMGEEDLSIITSSCNKDNA